jgi:hypothetical protein
MIDNILIIKSIRRNVEEIKAELISRISLHTITGDFQVSEGKVYEIVKIQSGNRFFCISKEYHGS